MIWLSVLLLACGPRRQQPPSDAIVVILPREPEQLDPRYVGDAYGVKISRLIHAGLVRMSGTTLEPMPDLAEQIVIESATRYRVRLRAGLAFADGTTLDSEDVVATYRALVDPRVKSRYVSTYSRVRSVRAEGPHEIVFELNEPHATFMTDLEIPVLRAEDAFQAPSADRPLVGAGPYRLHARRVGQLELVANPRYHGAPPIRPALRFVVIRDDNTRALRLLAGSGDLALNVIPPLLVPLFAEPEFAVRTAAGIGTTYLGVNLEHPALRDVRVRKAIAHAIDREGLIRYKLGGRAHLARSWIPPGHWAYDPQTPGYAFDPDRARALLDAAGLRPDEDGVRLRLTVRTTADRFVVSMVRAFSSMLAEVGIELEVRPSEMATLLADLTRGRFELTYLQGPDMFEPHTLSWFFASDHIPEPGKREGANRWRVSDRELDLALEQGRANVERSARVAIYRRVQHILARDLPVIPLWHEDVVAITSARMEGYVPPRDARFSTLARVADPPAE